MQFDSPGIFTQTFVRRCLEEIGSLILKKIVLEAVLQLEIFFVFAIACNTGNTDHIIDDSAAFKQILDVFLT